MNNTFTMSPADQAKLAAAKEWFRNAGYGMMIHWGLYSILAGEWQGKRMAGIGEWIQQYYRIPISEYEQYNSESDLSSFTFISFSCSSFSFFLILSSFYFKKDIFLNFWKQKGLAAMPKMHGICKENNDIKVNLKQHCKLSCH